MAGIISASTATYIAAGLSAAGTAAKGVGSLKGGQASGEAAAYRAQVAENNAKMYEQSAVRAIQGGEVSSDVAGLQTQQKVGSTKVAQAANNIDVNKGSAVDVRAGIAQAGRLNQETVLNNAQLQGYGYRVRAAQERAQAGLDLKESAGAQTAGGIGAAGSLLGAASSLPFGFLNGIGGSGDVEPSSINQLATGAGLPGT